MKRWPGVHRMPVMVLLALICSPLLAEEAPTRHDPLAHWLNEHSHEVLQGTLGMMLLVGDHGTIDAAGATLDATASALAVAEGLKLVIDQPRPREPAATDGFPSSHATSAFAFARGISDWRSHWGPYAYAFAAGVGWARVEEGYHTTEQVLAGAALGVWIAGAALDNDGFFLHRGADPAAMSAAPVASGDIGRFEGGPSVVLWRQAW